MISPQSQNPHWHGYLWIWYYMHNSSSFLQQRYLPTYTKIISPLMKQILLNRSRVDCHSITYPVSWNTFIEFGSIVHNSTVSSFRPQREFIAGSHLVRFTIVACMYGLKCIALWPSNNMFQRVWFVWCELRFSFGVFC